MVTYYSVDEEVGESTHGSLYLHLNNTSDKLILDEGLVAHLTYKEADFKTQLALFTAAISDISLTTTNLIDKKLRYIYKIDAQDIAKEINLTNNPGLTEKIGFKLSSTDRIIHQVEIEVINDVTPGQIIVILLAVIGAYNYNIECTQIGENDKADIITIRNITNARGILDSFVSGAKYMFRAQPITSRDNDSEQTEYVMLIVS